MIKEISRRCATSCSEGVSCGPLSIYGVIAEMEIEDNGNRLFLNAEWADEVPDEVDFEVTKESIFDIILCLDNDIDKLERIRSEAPNNKDEYRPYYEELVKLIKEAIIKDEVYDPRQKFEDLTDEELEEEGIDLNDEKTVWGF